MYCFAGDKLKFCRIYILSLGFQSAVLINDFLSHDGDDADNM